MPNNITLSLLPHTWILDVDGTLVKHNGYKIDGKDSLLPGVKEFFAQIPAGDMIILLTSRTEEYKKSLEEFMLQNKLRFDHIICNAPVGERILINDDKPGGLLTAIAINKKRDDSFNLMCTLDNKK